MSCAEYLEQMRSTDLCTADKDALTDMSGFHFNYKIPKKQRALYLLEAMKNPYCFRVGEVCVMVEFQDGSPMLQDKFSDFLHRQKNGL